MSGHSEGCLQACRDTLCCWWGESHSWERWTDTEEGREYLDRQREKHQKKVGREPLLTLDTPSTAANDYEPPSLGTGAMPQQAQGRTQQTRTAPPPQQVMAVPDVIEEEDPYAMPIEDPVIEEVDEDTVQKVGSIEHQTVQVPLRGPLVTVAPGYWIDQGVQDESQVSSTLFLKDKQVPYFEDFYYRKEHFNYLAADANLGPVVVSVARNFLKTGNDTDKYRVLLRTIHGFKHTYASSSKERTLVRACRVLEPELESGLRLKLCKDGDMEEHLITMERKEIVRTYKFGVIYCAPNQTTEREMLGNPDGSRAFMDFLDVLGDKVDLKGWDKFSGGLDTKSNSSGPQAIYTEWQGFEIMYHVSTLLPHSTTDKQQLLRKKHIGNDIVTVVFKEGNTPVDSKFIRSHYTHCVVVVQYESVNGNTMYRLAVSNKDGVKEYEPRWMKGATFGHDTHFREFLLAKLVNAERAAYVAPGFAQKFGRTKRLQLEEIVEKYDKGLYDKLEKDH
eukprot:TRINITY_DN4020_c0_g1_i1.p1 TRINITY_DN4020_c0_g1~~TRINITY_DN4020_c0_g1_i1.p1  ORF type:complete len:504 (-),score=93.15 TRINITY_DN4020_c0_g1_i1:105-1616(-)